MKIFYSETGRFPHHFPKMRLLITKKSFWNRFYCFENMWAFMKIVDLYKSVELNETNEFYPFYSFQLTDSERNDASESINLFSFRSSSSSWGQDFKISSGKKHNWFPARCSLTRFLNIWKNCMQFSDLKPLKKQLSRML